MFYHDLGLTLKHIQPSNLEKQNVQRAIDIFSPELIGAIRSNHDQGVLGFENVEATVTFMEYVMKWWLIMDISYTTQWTRQRLEDKKPFYSAEDECLKWLEEDFLQYLKDWRAHSKGKQFLTKETYQAVVLTTKCTIAIVKYLLNVKKFFFVLTRPFQSDPVESFFSNLRQLNGCLYHVEARGALLAIEKMLRTGLARASINGNVRMETTNKQVNY